MEWNVYMQYAALSDVGMRRSNNQDSYCVVLADDFPQWQRQGHLFLVADGMGAHAAGELASKMAADGVPHTYLKHQQQPAPEALRAAIAEINAQIHQRGEANIEFKGMGTTCSALLLLPEGALVGHVGDSRVYRFRKGQLEQLSFDHSLVWEIKSAGDFSDEDTVHLPKNVITRSLGPHPHVDVDLEGPFPMEVGDTYLVCSDGLTGEVRDDELGVILECLPPEEAVRVLVDLANLRGGPDNITVIVVQVISPKMTTAQPLAAAAATAVQKPASLGSPTLWVLAAVLVAVALGAWVADMWPVALVGLAAAVAIAVINLVQGLSGGSEPASVPAPRGRRRYGKGPHTTRKCAANSKIVADLAQLVEQLREAASEPQWSVDWEPFDSERTRGAAAAENKDHAVAVRHYCHAISFMMNELRNQSDTRA